jgi:hypothetical protein
VCRSQAFLKHLPPAERSGDRLTIALSIRRMSTRLPSGGQSSVLCDLSPQLLNGLKRINPAD